MRLKDLPCGKICAVLASIAIIHLGCRPVPKTNISFAISTILAYSGEPVSGINVSLESRTVGNGVFNGNYELIAEGTSNSEGIVELNFSRDNALDYQITGYDYGWFERQTFVNPDVFLDSEEQSIALAMTPKAEITIRLLNANPFDEMDAIQFRTLNTPGDYPTCSNAWGTFSGLDLVEERTCWIEADRHLLYTYRPMRNGVWFDYVVDSIYIPRGEALNFTLPW